MARKRQFPTTGTAGGVYHERESFRSGWGEARDLIKSKVYHGHMPVEDALILIKWYSIRRVLLQEGDEDEFEQEKDKFDATIPVNASGQLFSALKLITGYMSQNGTK